jgi:hypothetical protein
MLVFRMTVTIKPGNVAEFRELMKEARDLIDLPHATRIYESGVGGSSNKVIVEQEIESLAEFEKWYADFGPSPQWTAIDKRGWELRESVATYEFLNLVE